MKNFDSKIFMASLRKMLDEPAPANPDLRQLLNLKGEEFLRQAYRLILQREIDPAGMRHYADRANSRAGRLKVLVVLLLSPEFGKAPMWLMKAVNMAGKIHRSIQWKQWK